MGRIKYLKDVMELFKKSPVVTTQDIKRLVKKEEYTYLLLHNLQRGNKIFRLVKGCYTAHEDPTLTVYCYRPAYIGLQDALSFHNLWSQETSVTIITVRNTKGVRTVLGNNVSIYNIKSDYYFGYQMMKYEKFYIPVSDVEKTLIDLVYYNQPLHNEVLAEAKKVVDKEKLSSYIQRYKDPVRQRIGNKLRDLMI